MANAPLSPTHEPPPPPPTTVVAAPAADESAVRVAVRARPLIEKEIVEKCRECVAYSCDGRQLVLGKDRRFTFDHVFGPMSGQEDVYLDCVKPLVDSCIAGYNATVLAYGQTGSGKTFTMGCGNSMSLLEEELGILPRAIRHLYEGVEERTNQAEFLIKCAFVEIYNEEIKDLLHPDTPSKSISIREDANGDIILAGVKEEVVTSFENMIRCLEHGSVFRTTGSTLMNQQSSRSHAIFTIIVEQRSLQEGSSSNDVITAKFHLVDLAGSERAKRTGAVGMRFKESVTINCGLLALGNVISALGDERKRGHHVPYRESKLTRMLQDSLGGNSRTCMIACISTADTSFEETLNTLKYANRARNIRNKPVINRDPQAVMLNQLRQEVRALQVELLNTRMQRMGLEPVTGPQSLEILLQDESNRQFLDDIRSRADISVDVTAELQTVRRRSREREQECLKLQQEIQALQSLVSRLQEEMLELHTERDHYQLKLDEVNSEMAVLVQVVPQWEGSNEINPAAKMYLLEMAKRVVGEIDGEGSGIGVSSVSSSGTERPASADAAQRRGSSDFVLLSNGGNPRDKSALLNGRPRSQPDESQASVRDFISSPSKADARGASCISPGRTSRGTRNIINQHLRTIRVLEEHLAAKEIDVKAKDEALKEASEDLARDERIFAEKLKEIKALKKLARDLTNEKCALMQKTEKDEAIISRMSQEALAKEDELARLQASLEAWQSGRPDAFIMNGATVPSIKGKIKPETSFDDCGEAIDILIEGKIDITDAGGDASSLGGFDTDSQMRLEELTEKMKAEDEEKVRLLSEKKAIEEQKSLLEENVRHQTREFKRSKQVMDKQLHELSFSIQQKEELIQELARNEAEAKHLTQQYESRMLELEAEMRRKEEEVEALKKELEAIDKNALRGLEEKKRLREQYEEKVKKITDQLIALKKQRWEQESQRLEQQKAKSDVKMQQLQHEITRMRAQQDSLKKKIKETTEKFEDEHDIHLKNMAALKKESENQMKHVRELEMENQKQRQVMRRKNEEMAAANKKLKELGVLDTEVASSKISNRERSLAYDHSLKGNLKRVTTMVPVLETASACSMSSSVEQAEAMLDQEIDKLLKMKEARVLKDKQEAKKEEIMSEKDDCLNEKSKLELKHARAVHDVAQEAHKKTVFIQRLEKEIEDKQSKAEEAKDQGKLALAMELLTEVTVMREQCEHEQQACTALQGSQKPHKLLTQGEESLFGDLDERIEALDAEAEFMALSIAEHDREIQEGLNTKEAMNMQLQMIAAQDAKVILCKYLDKFVKVKEKQLQDAKRVANLEVQLKEKAQALDEVERNSRLKELEFDRRLTELQTQHAKNVQYLLKQVETVSTTPAPERHHSVLSFCSQIWPFKTCSSDFFRTL
ncbi:hypothetical protein BDL97_03G066500 [Sphagnum fallax]|nr:hypothetical protein BDL97_03G066500 [Sphagnum fallax]